MKNKTTSKTEVLPGLAVEAPWERLSLDENLELVIHALSQIRFSAPCRLESDVVLEVCAQLDRYRVPWVREFELKKGSRIDIFVGGLAGSEDNLSIGIEVKKGKPNTNRVRDQLVRYAGTGKLNALILVTERGLRAHIQEAFGVPIRYVSLAFNWGLTV